MLEIAARGPRRGVGLPQPQPAASEDAPAHGPPVARHPRPGGRDPGRAVTTWMPASARFSRSPRRAWGRSFAAVTLQDPDRAGLQRRGRLRRPMPAARDGSSRRADVGPDGPVAQTAAGPGRAGWARTVIHLPLAVTSAVGIDQLVGVLTIGRAGDAEPDDDERTTLGALAAPDRGRRRPRPARVDDRRALGVVRADGPHRSSDRAGQRADVRPDPRARAGPGRATGRRGLARAVRRRRPDRDQRDASGIPRATTSCARSRRSSPNRSGWWTPSPGSAAMSSCSSHRARPGSRWPSGCWTGSPRCRRSRARSISVSAGVARFPVDGGTAEDLRAAADAALGDARSAGRGTLKAPPATAAEG